MTTYLAIHIALSLVTIGMFFAKTVEMDSPFDRQDLLTILVAFILGPILLGIVLHWRFSDSNQNKKKPVDIGTEKK